MVTIRDRDPYFILPILAALFTFASTYLSSMSQIESNASLKIMNFAMPLMILLMGINIASGLSLYWVVSNAFQVVQTLILNNPFKIRQEREEAARKERERERALKKAMSPKKNVRNKRRLQIMPIYEGLTVDEAIQEGLHALGLNKDQAVIDVLDEGKRFLGIGKKNARVSIERSAADESKIITESVTEIIEEILEPELEESVLTAKSQADTEEKPNAKDLSDDEALTHLALYLTNISKALNAPALVKQHEKMA